LPFVLAVQGEHGVELTGVVRRITSLSKVYSGGDNVKRYLRLAPLIYCFKDIDVIKKMLVTSYLFPGRIVDAIRSGLPEYGIDAVHIEQVLADHDAVAKMREYSRYFVQTAPKAGLEALRVKSKQQLAINFSA